MPPKPPYAERPVDHIQVLDYRARKSRPGRRLDGYLAAKFHNYSRTLLTGLIREGKVTVNGRAVKPHYEIKRNDRVHVELPVFARHTLTPENIPIDVLHEDEHVLVINKPADIIVHPARAHLTGTLVNALVYYCDSLPESEDKVRPGIVHRLDRDTTGVMVVVKDAASRGWIGRQFEWRRVKKEYVAVVEGEMELDADRIALPLGRHKKHPEKMAVDRAAGRKAVTVYHVLERFRGFTYVRLELKTGRTHQIRVHLAAIGHPVACDSQYGRRAELYLSDLVGEKAGASAGDAPGPSEVEPHVEGEEPIIHRQALHARTIGFNHPGTREFAEYTAPLPADLERLLGALREHRGL